MDYIFEKIGTNKRYNTIVTLLILPVSGLSQFLIIGFAFLTKTPEFLCLTKESNDYFPCSGTDACSGKYEFVKDSSRSLMNLAYKFDLYCDKEKYIPLFGTILFFGAICAQIILPSYPDKIGRAPVFKSMLILIWFIHLNCLFIIGPIHILIIGFVSGFSCYAYTMSSMLMTEYLDRNKVGLLIGINNTVFAFFGIFIALFYLFINNMFILFLFTTILSFLMAYYAFKYLQESPRWLNCQNKQEELIKCLSVIVEINKEDINVIKLVNERQEELGSNTLYLINKKKNYSLFEIFSIKSIQKKMLILSYLAFANAFTTYGLMLNFNKMKGNLFINVIFSFSGHIIANCSSGYFADRYGRLVMFKIGGIIGGVGFIIYDLKNEANVVGSILLFFSCMGFAATFSLAIIYSNESIPTNIRSTSNGFFFLLSRLGAMLVPTVTSILPHYSFILGFMSLMSSYLSIYLDETLGKPIKDEIEE